MSSIEERVKKIVCEQLGVKEGKKIPMKKLEKAAKAPGKLGQRARLAKTLRSF